MPLRRIFLTSALALAFLACFSPRASADWLFTPYVGLNWGGTAGFSDITGEFENEFKQRMNFGGSLTWMGTGALGFEVDFGYSPNFFEDNGSPEEFQFIGESNVTTLMVNLAFGIPFGGQRGAGIRPYASGGVGLIKTQIDDVNDAFRLKSSDLGVNAGGGIAAFFNDRFGIRGDVRYFRSLQDNKPDDELDVALGSFRFWRGTVGFIFRF
jgi:hypothetical protein